MNYLRLAAGMLSVGLIAVSCGGDDEGGSRATATQAPESTASITRVAVSPVPGETAVPGESAEVTGIVGAVSADGQSIEITRTSGAAVNEVRITPTTRLRRAGGGRATVSQIRPSDRIIARGTLDERDGALVADEITIQAVVPGSAPGG